MIPIGSRVRVLWDDAYLVATVILHGVSALGEARLLMWLADGTSAGRYRWFGLEAIG